MHEFDCYLAIANKPFGCSITTQAITRSIILRIARFSCSFSATPLGTSNAVQQEGAE